MIRRAQSVGRVAALVTLLVGCGGTTVGAADAGGPHHDGATAHDSGARQDGGGTTHDGGVAGDTGSGTTACPASPPTAGVPCTTSGLTCEYGDDPSVSCDRVETCMDGAWAVTQAGPTTPCQSTNTAACPATFQDVPQAMSCPTQVDCVYPEARCACDVQCFSLCAQPVDGGPNLKTWLCDVPAPPTTCPIPRPRIGSPCATPAESCDYGGCSGNVSLQCKGGVWQVQPSACPV